MKNEDPQIAWSSLVLLEQVRAGDEPAAAALFSRYFKRLTSLARSRLSTRLARRTDPEDIVMSVYRSFFVGARAGRFTLNRGGDLWRLLSAITRHKLARQIRHEVADRRSVERELSVDEVDEARILERRQAVTPEEASAVADELEWVFGQLDAALAARPRASLARSRALRSRAGYRPVGTHRPTDSRPGPRSHGKAKGRSRSLALS